MVSLSLAAALLIVAIGSVSAQMAGMNPSVPAAGSTQPVGTPTTSVPGTVTALTPSPSLDPNLLVTPQELNDTRTYLQSIINNNPNVQSSCNTSQLTSDYYVLSVINCDRAQSQQGIVPVTSCPQACQSGITLVGAACVAATNVAYIKESATTSGFNFTLNEFDPSNTLGACNVQLDPVQKGAAFQAGQMAYLQSKLTTPVPSCNFTTLQSDPFTTNAAQCAAAVTSDPTCNAACTAAVNAAGATCLNALAAATVITMPNQYNAQFSMFTKCGISGNIGPAPAPAPSNPPPIFYFPPPKAPKSGAITATTTLSSLVVASLVSLALMM